MQDAPTVAKVHSICDLIEVALQQNQIYDKILVKFINFKFNCQWTVEDQLVP